MHRNTTYKKPHEHCKMRSHLSKLPATHEYIKTHNIKHVILNWKMISHRSKLPATLGCINTRHIKHANQNGTVRSHLSKLPGVQRNRNLAPPYDLRPKIYIAPSYDSRRAPPPKIYVAPLRYTSRPLGPT